MTFDYNTLKKAAVNGGKIGNWSGLPVFACSRENLRNRGNGAYYVIYDDENAFVKKMGEMFYRYGYLDKSGGVHEETKEVYSLTKKKKDEVRYDAPKAKFEYVPAAEHTSTSAPGPVADVKLEIDVEATLKKAREMTIEDLLAGFDYGL